MSEDRQETFERFDRLLRGDGLVKQLPLDGTSSYAILSDLHLGDGSRADNFAHNQGALLCALEYYRRNGYSVILAGDIEELWQFDLAEICGRYDNTVYRAFRSFAPGRLHRVCGNHDLEWAGLYDPTVREGVTHRWATEAVRLGDRVLITHGHQGELFSDKRSWISRFAARLFRYIEPFARRLGWGDKAATQSPVPKGRERTYYRWARDTGVILVCGHTHRAFFDSRSRYVRLREELAKLPAGASKAVFQERMRLRRELQHEKRRARDIGPLERDGPPLPCYFNCGCGCYTHGLTNLEIEGGTIRLVKWHNDEALPPDGRREVLGEGHLDEFIRALAAPRAA
jgi:UDP-2,3-diacylglucosamine pyrophosphatase LpxH